MLQLFFGEAIVLDRDTNVYDQVPSQHELAADHMDQKHDETCAHSPLPHPFRSSDLTFTICTT